MSTSPIHGSTGNAKNHIQPKRRIAPEEPTQHKFQAVDFNNLEHLQLALEQHPLKAVALDAIWQTQSPKVVRQIATVVKNNYGDIDTQIGQVESDELNLLSALLSRKSTKTIRTTLPSPELVKALIDMGANPNKRNASGFTAFDRIDASTYSPEVAKQIENILTKEGTIKPERSSMLERLAYRIRNSFSTSTPNQHSTQQPSVPTQNGLQNPPVTSATSSAPQPKAKTTPNNSSQIEGMLKNTSLETIVLNYAKSPDNVRDIAQVVVAKTGHVDNLTCTPSQLTLLHILMTRRQSVKPELIKVLMDMGADPKKCDRDGYNAFDRISFLRLEPAEEKDLMQVLTKNGTIKPEYNNIFSFKWPANPLPAIKNYVSQKMANTYANLPELPSLADLMPPILMNPFITHNPLMAGLHQPQSGAQVENTEPEYKETGAQTDPLPEDPRIQEQEKELTSLRAQMTQLSTQSKALEGKLEKSQAKLAKSQQTQEKQQAESAAEQASLTAKNRQLRENLTKFKKAATKEQETLKAAIETTQAQNTVLEIKLQEKIQSSQAHVSQLETEKHSLHEKLTQAEQTLKHTQEQQEKALQHSKRQQQQQTSQLGRLKQENAKLHEDLQTEKTRHAEEMAQLSQKLEAAQKERKELQGELSKAKMSAATHLITHAQVQQAQIDAKELREKLEKTQTEAATEKQQSAQHIEALTQAQQTAAKELAEAQAAIRDLEAQLLQKHLEVAQHGFNATQAEQREQAQQMELAAIRERATVELEEAQQAYADMMAQWQQDWDSADHATRVQAQAANGIIISLGDQLAKALKALGRTEEEFPLLAEVDPQAGLPEDQQTEQEGQPKWYVPFPQTGQPIERLHPSYMPVQGPFGLGTMYMTAQAMPQIETHDISNPLLEDEPESPGSATSQSSNPQAATSRQTKEAPGRLESTGHAPPMLNAEQRSQSWKHFKIPQD